MTIFTSKVLNQSISSPFTGMGTDAVISNVATPVEKPAMRRLRFMVLTGCMPVLSVTL